MQTTSPWMLTNIHKAQPMFIHTALNRGVVATGLRCMCQGNANEPNAMHHRPRKHAKTLDGKKVALHFGGTFICFFKYIVT